MMCFAVEHQSHKCSEIKNVQDDFQKQMAVDVDSIAARVDKFREMAESLEKEKSEFVEQVEKTGVEIIEKAEQLKRMIDDHREKLMNELSLMKQKKMKEIESLREEIERQLLSMESYKKYVDEVRQKGTACDIARAAGGLHDRAEVLLKFDAIERALDDLGHTDVMFASSDFVVDDVGKTLGQLKLKSTGNSNYLHCALALQVNVGCDTVTGLLFVPRCLSVQCFCYATLDEAIMRQSIQITTFGLLFQNIRVQIWHLG